ncbi:MAG: small basic protein [Planctomycetota bacterium]
MSLHKSLKTGNAMVGHRNVLTRVERLEKLEAQGRWGEEKSILGIPSVRNPKPVAKKKKKAAPTAEA